MGFGLEASVNNFTCFICCGGCDILFGMKLSEFWLLNQEWYPLLSVLVRESLLQAVYLLAREEELYEEGKIFDYGFLVFPAAKAYEGFLKDYLLALNLIDERDYRDEYFRIGRSLNPDLPRHLRNDVWVYGKLVQLCGRPMAEKFWLVWKEARNQIFHYKDTRDLINYETAEERVKLIVEVMEEAFACEAYRRGVGKT
jgi:hypothetical protein